MTDRGSQRASNGAVGRKANLVRDEKTGVAAPWHEKQTREAVASRHPVCLCEASRWHRYRQGFGANVAQHPRPALARNNVLTSMTNLRRFDDNGPEHRIGTRSLVHRQVLVLPLSRHRLSSPLHAESHTLPDARWPLAVAVRVGP